ncbi:hypothetical protein FUAX_36130 [Fulvitalea axinellae]|uniref:HTH marR-type domain-containing protein n=1 Tax=Fulvitalea axinellae TaxID=1182444 RepID=A0AAU9CGB2_9BACT|nr:hypothetical protein FUAX_36130 [Fulvitalea axinellae]
MTREESVDYIFKSVWHAIYRMYNQHANKHGFTTTVGFVLLNIHYEKGTPATKIAPKLGLEPRSLTRILKSMEEEGLIHKKKDSEDKRTVNIYLTEEGRRKRELAKVGVMGFNQSVRKLISDDELENLQRVAGKVFEVVRNLDLSEETTLDSLED